MLVGSLFSGIGGMDLGLERAGFQIAWQCEIDPFCRSVLSRHFPGVPCFRDVRGVTSARAEAVDLVCGGFPCQDISVTGTGAGLEGERSGLWYEMLRIVRELRPAWVLVENVPRLRTLGADRVLEGLESAGYSGWPLVVGADDIGAPHIRKRVWIVAHSDSRGREVLRKQDRHSARAEHGKPSGDQPDGRDLWRMGERIHAFNCPLGCDCECDAFYPFPAPPGITPYEWEPPKAEPGMGGGAYGISDRMDASHTEGSAGEDLLTTGSSSRLRALGNAVVPQVVEAIGRAILAHA